MLQSLPNRLTYGLGQQMAGASLCNNGMARSRLVLCRTYLTSRTLFRPATPSAYLQCKLSSPTESASLPDLSGSISHAQNSLDTNQNVEQFVLCGNIGLQKRGYNDRLLAIGEEDDEEGDEEDEEEDYDNDDHDSYDRRDEAVLGAFPFSNFSALTKHGLDFERASRLTEDRPSTTDEDNQSRDLPPADEAIDEPEDATPQDNRTQSLCL